MAWFPYTRTLTVPWASPGGWLSVTIAAAIVACSFVARGGVRLEPTTDVEIGLMLGGSGLVVAACLQPARGRPAGAPYGIWVVLAFALLAAYTALSIIWSVARRSLPNRRFSANAR